MNKPTNTAAKSTFSRLLASENIFVVHDEKAKTASFDVKSRTLVLPVLRDMSNELYDMFIGHEVAHALFTPFTDADNECIKEHKCLSAPYAIAEGDKDFFVLAHSYMNIIEDVRIERLIKDKFHGLRRDFYIGYGELFKRGFFDVNEDTIGKMSFIDRINIYFKCGNHINVPFTDEEMEYVNMVDSTVTYDDVVEVTKKIWKYVKDKKKNLVTTTYSDFEFSVDGEDENESDVNVDGDGSKPKRKSNDGIWSSRKVMPDECLTQQSFDKKFENLMHNKEKYASHSYFNLPTFKSEAIVDYKTIMSLFDEEANKHGCITSYRHLQVSADKFISDSTKVVNILAQSFMTKKAAKDHHRNSVHRTGMIDTVRMVDYKFTDDIFRRLKVVKKGKSHGLVFFVDLSGSMSPIIEDTLKQMIQLVLFCKRVNIPFEVYGFTTRLQSGQEFDFRGNEIPNSDDPYTIALNKTWNQATPSHYKSNIGGSPVNPFTLVNLFSSRMNNREISVAVRNAFAMFSYYQRSSMSLNIPAIMHLSSTPLIEAIVSAMDIVPKFKMNNKLDIVHTIFLTDGEPTGVHMCYHDSHYMKGSFLFDSDSKSGLQNNMIQMFKEYTGSKAIQFFISGSKTSLPEHLFNGISSYNPHRQENCGDYDKWEKTYRKEGWAVSRKGASMYDEQFIIRANSNVDDVDLDSALSQRSSNVGIRNAFVKAMNSSIVSRIMLNRFIDLIATE